MNKDVLKTIILDKQRAVPRVVLQRRVQTFGERTNYVIVGLRRAGKSYTLYQDIQTRITSGLITAEDILFINFEDERLTGVRATELGDIFMAYAELYGADRRPDIYLDEVQIIDGWQTFARRIADEGYRVMITGSNAKMLSAEIATTLGGRYVPREVDPFTFAEYIEHCGITLTPQWRYNSAVRVAVTQAFDTYLHYGGIAEGFRQEDKREYLGALYQKILLGDIVERNKIRASRVFRLIARKLADSVMQPVSLTRLQHIVKSAGDTVSLPILKDYLEYMAEAFLTFDVPNMAAPLTERETIKKRYFTDNGLLNLSLHRGETKLLENVVAVALRRSVGSGEEPQLFYYNRGVEVDFVIPRRCEAIQVTWSMTDATTREREVGALARFLRHYPTYTATIVTAAEEGIEVVGAHTITITPAWRFLLPHVQ